MPQIYGSYNSRFFAVLREGRMALYRGAAPLWTRPVAAARELVRVGNQGDVFFRTDQGVARLPLSRDSEMELVEPLVEAITAEEGGQLGGVRVNAEGTEICVERITTSARLSRKLLRMLRRGEKTEVENRVDCHELLLFNRNTGALRKFCRTDIDPERKGRFVWTSSPNLAFLLVGVPGTGRKPTLSFKLIHTREESIYSEFEMKVSDISNLWVTETGTVLLEVRVSPEEAYLVLTTLEGEKLVMNPPPDYRVLNLGLRSVTLWTGPQPQVLIKDFSDQTVCQADLSPLDRLGLHYELLFNERGGLDLITLKGRELRVNHTDSESLAVDARRWEVLARQQESVEVETVQKEEEQKRQDEEKSRRQEERSRELAHALSPESRSREVPQDFEPEPLSGDFEPEPLPDFGSEAIPEIAPETDFEPPVAPQGRPRSEIEAELEKLRMSYVSGAIQRSEYHRRAGELKAELDQVGSVARGEASPGGLLQEASPPPVPVLQVEPASFDTPLPSRTPPARPIWSGDSGQPPRQLDLRDFEKRKVERLLEALEERLVRQEISESTYRELKARYLKRQTQA